MNRLRPVALVLPIILAAVLPAPLTAQYAVAKTYALGGEGGWDYVIPDSAHRRVFIGRQDRVMVVDERDGKLLGEVTGIHGAHGVALVDATKHGFATSGNDSSIYMFDLTSFKVLGRAPRSEQEWMAKPLTPRAATRSSRTWTAR